MRRWPMILLVLVFLLVGCTPHPDPPVPSSSPTDPAAAGFSGRIIVVAHTDNGIGSPIWQLTIGSDRRLTATELAKPESPSRAVGSPDGRKVAYLRRTSLVVRDLVSGQEQTIDAAGEVQLNNCLAWAADSERLLVRSRLNGNEYLSVVGLDGRMIPLVRTIGTLYVPDGSGNPTPRSGELTCGRWLDADRIVFDRLKAMPNRVQLPVNELEVPADTTTVAVLGANTVRLVDSATRWRLVDACGGRVATAELTGNGTFHLLDAPKESDLMAPNGMLPAGAIVPDVKTDPHHNDFAFVPGSCQPVIGRPDGVHPLDKTTHAVEPKVLVADPDQHAYSFLSAIWNPKADGQQLADVVGDSGIQLSDLRTGYVVHLNTDEKDGLHIEDLLTWAP